MCYCATETIIVISLTVRGRLPAAPQSTTAPATLLKGGFRKNCVVVVVSYVFDHIASFGLFGYWA